LNPKKKNLKINQILTGVNPTTPPSGGLKIGRETKIQRTESS